MMMPNTYAESWDYCTVLWKDDGWRSWHWSQRGCSAWGRQALAPSRTLAIHCINQGRLHYSSTGSHFKTISFESYMAIYSFDSDVSDSLILFCMCPNSCWLGCLCSSLLASFLLVLDRFFRFFVFRIYLSFCLNWTWSALVFVAIGFCSLSVDALLLLNLPHSTFHQCLLFFVVNMMMNLIIPPSNRLAKVLISGIANWKQVNRNCD